MPWPEPWGGAAIRLKCRRYSREALRREQTEAEAELRSVRATVDRLREQLRSWGQQTSAIQQEREALGREQAIAEERQRWLLEQVELYGSEIGELDLTIAGFNEELQTAEVQIEKSRAALEVSKAGHAELIAEGEVASVDRDRLRLDADRARGALEALAARVAVWESRQEQLKANHAEQGLKLEARGRICWRRSRGASRPMSQSKPLNRHSHPSRVNWSG